MLNIGNTVYNNDCSKVTQKGAAFIPQSVVKQAMGQPGLVKSCRRPPHKTTEDQKRILLAEFEDDPNPAASKRERLAKMLNVERRIIKNWFSNQRALRRKSGLGYRGYPCGRASSWSASASGDEDDSEASRGGESPTVTNASTKRIIVDGVLDEDRELESLSGSLSSPAHTVLRITTSAYAAQMFLTSPHIFHKKLHVLPPQRTVLPPFSSLLVNRQPSILPLSLSTFSPSSWSPSPLNHPHPKEPLTPTRGTMRCDHEKYFGHQRGYPVSALRTSLEFEIGMATSD